MSLNPYLKIIRPVNLLIMAAMLLLVRYAIFLPVFRQNGIEGLMPWWQFLMLVAASLLIGAGGYVINDVLDIEIDRVNKPEKQIIGKKITEAAGNRLHMNLTGAGVVLGLAFSYLAGNVFLGIIFVIIPTALFYYSYKYKYQPVLGNIVVSLLAALTVAVYWLFEFYSLKKQPDLFIEASLVFPQLNRFVLAFAFFAFITTLIREIIKDMQDMEGDSRFGCRTLPVVAGIPATRAILAALELITLASLTWFQYRLYNSGYSPMALALFLADGLLLYALVRTFNAREKRASAHLSLVIKIIMVSGMLSLITSWFRVL